MALADKLAGDGEGYTRLGVLLEGLMEYGLASGNNPIIVQDEDGGEFVIIDVTNETGDIGIIIKPKYDPYDPENF